MCLDTFFRSATHATDSTLIGCNAKRAATSRLGPVRLVIHTRPRKSSTTFRAWIITLLK